VDRDRFLLSLPTSKPERATSSAFDLACSTDKWHSCPAKKNGSQGGSSKKRRVRYAFSASCELSAMIQTHERNFWLSR
jgi:hypothetical protein